MRKLQKIYWPVDQCRRYVPVPTTNILEGTELREYEFPIIELDSWCGEFVLHGDYHAPDVHSVREDQDDEIFDESKQIWASLLLPSYSRYPHKICIGVVQTARKCIPLRPPQPRQARHLSPFLHFLR